MKIILSVLSGFLLLFATHARPQEPEPDSSSSTESQLDLFDEDVELTRDGWAQFYVAAGIMHLDADGVYQLRFPNGSQFDIINFERVGLNDTDASHWFSLNWRSRNSRWGTWFASWRFEAAGIRGWDKILDLGNGIVIPAEASVTSEFDTTWYILELTYSFYRSKTGDAGFGIGLHTVDVDTQLTARVNVGGLEKELVSARLDTLAPLPCFQAYAAWKFSPRWTVAGRIGYFGLGRYRSNKRPIASRPRQWKAV